MKITLENYTESIEGFCSELSLPEHNAHMAMGIVEEFHELELACGNNDRANQLEELGDIAWYIAMYCKKNSMRFVLLLQRISDIYNTLDVDRCSEFTIHTLSKKELAYKLEPTFDQRESAVWEVLIRFLFALKMTNFNLDLVLQTNFEKLTARYNGKKFDFDRALNRDFNTESEVLERNLNQSI